MGSRASSGALLSCLLREGESEAVRETALRLVRALRYILRRAAEAERDGMDASAFREAFHEIVSVLRGLLTGEVPSEVVVSLLNCIDKAAQDGKMDGGPGSGNHGHKGRPGQQGGSSRSLSPKEREKIKKRLVGQKTHDGIEIKSVSSHAFDRIGGRKMSTGRIDQMRTQGKVSPGNQPDTRCYDIEGSRMVLNTATGNIITVMWRGGKKE